MNSNAKRNLFLAGLIVFFLVMLFAYVQDYQHSIDVQCRNGEKTIFVRGIAHDRSEVCR